MPGAAPNGVALSIYGEGTIGAAVKRSKSQLTVVPAPVPQDALALGNPRWPYAGQLFDAVAYVPPTASGDYLGAFARDLASRLGIPAVGLVKTRTTQSQKRFRSKALKKANVRGAFERPSGCPALTTVLLVDEVWHTGSTLQEAARALRPVKVYPLTLARTKRQV